MSDSAVAERGAPRSIDPAKNNLERGKVADWVAASILRKINDGTLGPGVQLRQQDLAESLGVSRVPVREALHALARQRVIVHEERRGFFVANWSPHELRQLARLLELIENDVLATVRWPTTAEIRRLRALSDRIEQLAPSTDVLATMDLNQEFHFIIFALSPNTLMIDELERLWRLSRRFITWGMATAESRERRVAEHKVILERLECRDRAGLLDASIRHRERHGNPEDSLLHFMLKSGTITDGRPSNI